MEFKNADGSLFVLGPCWIRYVNDLGMDFGLWVEPEMINPDSDLYRAHPDWVFHFPNRPRTELRHQLVLNMAREETREYSIKVLDDLLSELNLIRELLTTGSELSDIQLFSQLKNLSEIKAALMAMPSDTANRMLREVDQLLDTVFASSKFGL